jgi:hypothetical protein
MKHIVYMLLHVPCIWRVKIGITGRSSKERASEVTRAVKRKTVMPGRVLPIGIMFIPFFAKPVEQSFHFVFFLLKTRFYKGDGSTEWFYILVAPVFYGLMWLHLVVWLEVLRLIFKTI